MSDIPENRRSGSQLQTGNGVAHTHTQIASKLKALYNAVEREPISDKFLDLLEQLDKAEQLSKSDT